MELRIVDKKNNRFSLVLVNEKKKPLRKFGFGFYHKRIGSYVVFCNFMIVLYFIKKNMIKINNKLIYKKFNFVRVS